MRRWIANYEKEMSFDDFKDKLGISNNPTNVSKNRTIEEIIEDVNNIIESEVIVNGDI